MIKIENLTKKFDDFTAVDDLSFEIYRNEIFGLLGPNGAGKTTSMSMICGLLPPTSGSISFAADAKGDRKSLIGYCPQENIFYPKLTCLEQLIFIGSMYDMPSKTSKDKARTLLKLLGLEEKAHTLASNLSGGMKRRLNICLAIIHDPEILILDEPEAGLDPQSRILVRDFIKNFRKEKTIILTTHNMDEADRLADRIAIVDHGKLLLLDTPANLKKTVGEGDVLEIVTENASSMQPFLEKVSSITGKVLRNNSSVLIQHPGIIDHLPHIKQMADSVGLVISELKLRENTLEDVFIHLTGRNLRQ